MSDRDQSPGAGGNPDDQPKSEHLNIKVTDNNNEVFFKIKRTTALSKLMNAFCERQGKAPSSVRFLFDGARVNPTDSPDSVSTLTLQRALHISSISLHNPAANPSSTQLEMADGDTLEVHQEQIGGAWDGKEDSSAWSDGITMLVPGPCDVIRATGLPRQSSDGHVWQRALRGQVCLKGYEGDALSS